MLELCVTRTGLNIAQGCGYTGPAQTSHTYLDVHTQSAVKYTGTCPKAIRTVSSVCVFVQVRNAFNNLTQTDLDLTPSGSAKPLNPLWSPQYPQIIYTHTPSYITLRNLSGSSRLSHAFLFPFLQHPSDILLVGKGAVIAEVGSFLPAPTQQKAPQARNTKESVWIKTYITLSGLRCPKMI